MYYFNMLSHNLCAPNLAMPIQTWPNGVVWVKGSMWQRLRSMNTSRNAAGHHMTQPELVASWMKLQRALDTKLKGSMLMHLTS